MMKIISKDYRSYALEFALPIINEKKKISIQHLLVVGYGKEKMIVKHWRQDWIYQNRDSTIIQQIIF